jgi:GT2 family glycosyltransferase
MHRFQYGPNDLPEALVPCRCPVTAALQLIRHETLETVGLYDEAYRMCFEDVDYCLRVFDAGLECIYEPSVRAFHHEKYFRSKPSERVRQWTLESTRRMRATWGATDLSRWVPEVL